MEMPVSDAPTKPVSATTAALDASERLTRLFTRSQAAMRSVVKRQMESLGGHPDPLNLREPTLQLLGALMRHPSHLLRAELTLWWKHMQLVGRQLQRATGSEAAPLVSPEPGDKRFRAAEWSESMFFDTLKQSYLLTGKWIRETLSGVDGLDERNRQRVDFFARQYISALSPTNFALTNPEVIAETVKTGGENLLRGLEAFLDDVRAGDGQLKVRLTDETAFVVGKDIATSPGKVVFQTPLAQLVQFLPTTEVQHERPLLIVPPWINKYYILDLRPDNSFIKWATGQGHTVFVLSWVNPTRELAKKTFEDYMREGTLAALDAIEKATGAKQVNAVGYCLGGTLLACTLGYLAAAGEDRIASATFLASLADFTEAGDLRLFIDEAQVKAIEERMEKQGYLDEQAMAFSFNAMRENDLVWAYVIHNYLLGRAPVPFDLLFWNADATRMPAAMHSFYLRKMYLENRLVQPGGLTLLGKSIDLRQVKVPVYLLSLDDDHIAPWRATYKATQVYGGPVEFVLGGSGHIAGVVNPPAKGKYGFRTHTTTPADPSEWLAQSTSQKGSWWTHWQAWVGPKAGQPVPARTPGDGGLAVLENAPGSYVLG
jgi:polyhydroxyalkanoate synthase